jgi:hypothetical protein
VKKNQNHGSRSRRQNVNAGNLGFLVQLLVAKFGHLFESF